MKRITFYQLACFGVGIAALIRHDDLMMNVWLAAAAVLAALEERKRA